jgi:thiol peroxidase
MASINDGAILTNGYLPTVGSALPAFTLTSVALEDVALSSLPGRKVLNIFPSIDTGVCSTSVRRFNELAGERDGVTVVNIAADLPFAMKRWCGAEGLANVVTMSTFRSTFADDMGVRITNGRMAGLCARAVVVVDEAGVVVYTELVPQIGQEPDYEAALAAV